MRMPPFVPISAWCIWDLQLFKSKLFILVWRYTPKSLSGPARERMLPVGWNLGQALGLQLWRMWSAPCPNLRSGDRGSKQAEKPIWGDRCCGSPEEGLLHHTGVSGMLLREVREASEVQSLGGERPPVHGQLPASEAAWSTGQWSRHRPHHGGAAKRGKKAGLSPEGFEAAGRGWGPGIWIF